MSDPYERSYYEIALTNGQVLVALGMLLGCLFGAFLSGMWVAKKAMDRSPAPVHAAAVVGEDAESDKGFEFFGGAAGPGAAAAGASASLPTPERSAPQAVVPLAAGQPGPLAEGLPVAAEAAPAMTPASSESSVAEDGEPRVAAGQPAAGQPAANQPAAGAPPVAAGGSPTDLEQVAVIQVFSSNDQQQASQLLGRLRGAGYRAFQSPVTVDGRTMYRVRVGPFDSRAEAQVEAEKIKRIFKLDTWITAN